MIMEACQATISQSPDYSHHCISFLESNGRSGSWPLAIEIPVKKIWYKLKRKASNYFPKKSSSSLVSTGFFFFWLSRMMRSRTSVTSPSCQSRCRRPSSKVSTAASNRSKCSSPASLMLLRPRLRRSWTNVPRTDSIQAGHSGTSLLEVRAPLMGGLGEVEGEETGDSSSTGRLRADLVDLADLERFEDPGLEGSVSSSLEDLAALDFPESAVFKGWAAPR